MGQHGFLIFSFSKHLMSWHFIRLRRGNDVWNISIIAWFLTVLTLKVPFCKILRIIEKLWVWKNRAQIFLTWTFRRIFGQPPELSRKLVLRGQIWPLKYLTSGHIFNLALEISRFIGLSTVYDVIFSPGTDSSKDNGGQELMEKNEHFYCARLK